MNKLRLFFHPVVLFLFFCIQAGLNVDAGTLSCSITTAAGCTGTVMLRMSSSTNAHAEIATGTTPAYANSVICCTGVVGLGNTCGGGTGAVILRLASTTNSHVQMNTQSGYANDVCISVPVGGSVSIAYNANNCTGYDTTLGSVASTSNSHVGDASSFTTKICGMAMAAQTLTFSLSTNTVNFGSLTSSSAVYASSTGQGSASEVEAHTLTVSTNASSGYVVTVQGATLTSQQNTSNTITAIGGANTTSSPGNEQFGLRIATSSGTGLITTPYAASGFAYAATATTTSQVASGAGDGVSTVYSVRYIANIGTLTEAGAYKSNLVYVATANY